MKLTKEEIEVFSQEPIELFYQGIRSPITKSKYTEILKRVLCEILEDFLQGSFEQRVKQLVMESKQNPEWATMILLAIAKKLKERTVLSPTNKNYLNPSSVPNYFKPIRKLFDMNSVPTAWPRIYAAFPETNNNSEGRGYTRQEIQKMLNFAKGALDRAIILVAASSGIREGGLVLQWKDLRPVYRVKDKLVFEIMESEIDIATIVCAVITIYRKSNEVNYAFITPEAYNALMDYKMTWFKETGRQPKDDDPIFKNAGSAPTSLSGAGIKARMYRVAKSSGVWVSPKGGSRRSEIPIMNGFRRFFNKMNKESVSKDSTIGALTSKQSNSKLQKTREYVEDHQFLTNWDRIEQDGWMLPATKEAHYWCGNWQTFGCLNTEMHNHLGKGNRIYVKQYQRSCYRASCVKCYLNWIARQANVSTTRINQYGKSRVPVHLLLSVNSNQYYLKDKELRQRAKKILEVIGFEGGAIIFHPFKFNKKIRCWYYAPHFHVIGFVNRYNICKGYGKFGWYVKDLGLRDSIFQSFCYLLSHCGIKKGVHSVSWIGRLSYSKLKVEKEPRITKCPVCGGDFEEIYYEYLFHPVIPPDKPYEGLAEADGWHPVQTDSDIVLDKYEYHPLRDINEIIKGIATAS